MLYFEILHPTRPSTFRPSLPPGIYVDNITLLDGEMVYGVYAYGANRIWCEQNDTVKYVKHRHIDAIDWEVDMKEFLFIKLKAKVLE